MLQPVRRCLHDHLVKACFNGFLGGVYTEMQAGTATDPIQQHCLLGMELLQFR